jgi:sugar/nucleoside kinase (ribokinase family)
MIAVVGAVAVDVVARRKRFLAGTSNPSGIRWAPGGVGYRIWSRLPSPRILLSAVGDDPAGRWLEQHIREQAGGGRAAGKRRREAAGRDRRGAAGEARSRPGSQAVLLRLPRYATACYCALMQSGRLLYGAADMEVIERGLGWARLEGSLPALGPADFLVLEANLAPGLACALLGRYAGRTRVVFEAVSVEKLLRHEPGLRDLYLLSVNREEAAALRARVAPGSRGQAWVGSFLRERRIANLLVPLGRRGARLHALGPDGRLHSASFAPARRVRAEDSTGAGDRLLAALLARLARAESAGRGPDAEGATPVAQALPAAMREVEKALEEGSL